MNNLSTKQVGQIATQLANITDPKVAMCLIITTGICYCFNDFCKVAVTRGGTLEISHNDSCFKMSIPQPA